MLDDRDRLRRGCRGVHFAARLLAREGEQRFELQIVGEARAVVGVEHAAILVETERALSRRLERGDDAVRIAHRVRAAKLAGGAGAGVAALASGVRASAAIVSTSAGSRRRENGAAMRFISGGTSGIERVTADDFRPATLEGAPAAVQP